MNAVLTAFFEREHWYTSLGCAEFDFDPGQEIFNEPGCTDGGVHTQAHLLLNGYRQTHQRALVILDQQFGGEIPAADVRDDILKRLHKSGWGVAACEVVVIDPELEVWLWQDNPNVEQALKFNGGSLREYLDGTGDWPAGRAKPNSPKEVMQALMKKNGAGLPMVVYRKIARSVGVGGCTDGSFGHFQATLQAWFPSWL